MITTKERSLLKGISHNLKPIMQIGKGGISDNVIAQAKEHLYNGELIKIKVLQNAEFTAKEIVNDFAKLCDADVVSCIGGIITLYKYSQKEGIEHIKF